MDFIIFLGSLNPYGLINWLAAAPSLFYALDDRKSLVWVLIMAINITFGALIAYADIITSSGV